MFLQVLLPFPVLQCAETVQATNFEQVLLQEDQLSVSLPCQVCFAERPYDKPVLLVHDKVAAEVVQHDGVMGAILIWELCPDEAKRFAVKHACSAQLIQVLRMHKACKWIHAPYSDKDLRGDQKPSMSDATRGHSEQIDDLRTRL